jgi:rubrerythrin
MHKMTAANLRDAHGGESMAHMRYKAWGEKAAEEGFDNVARLFRAIAHAEQIHATNHFVAVGEDSGPFRCASMAEFGYGNTSDNLQGGIDGETFEVNEMYPAYLDVAKSQGEGEAIKSFHYAYSAEQTHAALFKKAKDAADRGDDPALDAVGVCEVCGWTHEGELPEECPICKAKREQFTIFE